MSYLKPYTAPPQQIAILQARGLGVQDSHKALLCLSKIGYYRLSAYWYPFRHSHLMPHTGSGVPEVNKFGPPTRYVTDQFKAGYDFKDAHNFYVFDKNLRILLSDALERIEVAIRSMVVEHLGKIDPLAHRNPINFSYNFQNKQSQRSRPGQPLTRYQDWLNHQDKLFQRSKEDFAEHFRAKYGAGGTQHPAIWVASETWDFGALSHCFSGLAPNDKHQIASVFHKMNGNDLATWLRHLNDIRNVCAHHSRLWNRNTANPPKISKPAGKIVFLDHLNFHDISTRRLYGGIAICAYMMRILHPKTQWHIRFRNFVLTEAPKSSIIDTKIAGFPNNWNQLPLWN